MRWLKSLLILIALSAAIIFGGGLLLSPRFTVMRTVDIKAPASVIYPLVADPRSWPQWSAWNRRDPAMQTSFSGAGSGAGAGWAWRSDSQGNGRMAFVAAEPERRIQYELHFQDLDRATTGAFLFEPIAGDATRVSWVMNGDTGTNPLMRWFALGADRIVGRDFEAGLDNLKALAERR